jgi:hypothetical protein
MPAARICKQQIYYYNINSTIITTQYSITHLLSLPSTIMKYNAVVFTALAVAVSIVHATPIQIQARNAPKDPFVDCLRQSYPKFPSKGAPTTQELRACFAQAKPSTKREETQSTLEQDLYVEETNPEPGNNNTNLI